MLRVLQIIPTLDRSGAEKQLVLLATGLPKDRFEVEVAALTRLGPLEADLRAAGVPVTLLAKRHKVDPLALFRLARFIKDRRFDVVQTWLFAGNVYGRLAARRARVPIVITTEMAVDLWKSRTHLNIDRRLARWTDVLVGNSQAVVDFYRERAGVPAAKLRMIHSGIGDEVIPTDAGADVRAELGIPPSSRLIVYIGRLAEQKGLDVLLRALDLLQHVRPDYLTLIVGDGPIRPKIEGLARAFELGPKVRVLGHRNDATRLLAAADVLVLPSRYEGLPNVVLEAMRFEKPVVATRAPGTTEVVADGETGVLVPINDAAALAQALRALLDDPERCRRLGAAGLRRVREHFRVETMIERFSALYEELARLKGPGS